MNNLNANASAFLWQVPPPQQLTPQSVQQQTVQSVQSMQSVQHSQLLQSAVVSQPRKFGGNKSNYNYMQNHAIMGPGGGPMGGIGGNPNIYRKRHSINTYNAGLYQTNGKQRGSSAIKISLIKISYKHNASRTYCICSGSHSD